MQKIVPADREGNSDLQFHPAANVFPLMEGAEFDALVEDIRKNALRFLIVLHQGKVLDGRNRYRAMLALGRPLRKDHFTKWEPALDTDTPLSYVITANLHRRHLTAEQRREVIAKLVKAQPEKSNRQIAKQAKVDDKTVGAVRRELESTAEIPQLEKTVGADGKARKQPAKKPRKRGKPLPLPERTAEQQDATRRELEAAMAEPDAQIERDRQECVALYQNVKAAEHEQARACLDLAEKLRAAEIKIVGLESEVEELKRENAELRRQLEAKDDGIPDCLRRAPAPSSAS